MKNCGVLRRVAQSQAKTNIRFTLACATLAPPLGLLQKINYFNK
jgi:hypothetical protein